MLMLVERLHDPCSKRSNWFNQQEYLGIEPVQLQHLYRCLDKLADNNRLIQRQIFQTGRDLFNQQLDVVFYDVTTLYFESEQEQEGSLLQKGFSKDGKIGNTQILFCMLIDKYKSPIGYRIFKGDTFEGHTFEKALDDLKREYQINKIVVLCATVKKNPCENLHPFTFFLQGVYYRSSYLNVCLVKQSHVIMRERSKCGNVSILCSIFLIAVTISCNNQSQLYKKNQVVQTKIDTKLLKFTTGVRSVLEDSKENIWFSSYNEGVCLLHDGELQYFTTENGLSNNQVRSIYEDRNGIIWFECGRGLSTYDGKEITTYKERNYNAKNEWKLNESDLWFKGDETSGYNKLEGYAGVYQYDGQQLSYRTFPVTPKLGNEFPYPVSTSFVKSKDGTVWFGTYGAVIRYNGSDFKILDNEYLGINAKTGSLHVRSIMEDSKGNLWIGNNGIGVLKYDGEKVINFTAQQKLKKEDTKGNSLDRVFSIGEDGSGNIWFGTVEFGVWRYDGSSMKNFTIEDGLESKHIWLIYKSKQGELWLAGASPSGVFRFNGKSFERIY